LKQILNKIKNRVCRHKFVKHKEIILSSKSKMFSTLNILIYCNFNDCFL